MPFMSLGTILVTASLLASPPSSSSLFSSTPPSRAPQVEPVSQETDGRPMTPEQALRAEIEAMLADMQELRTELAQARLEAAEAQRELEELRQFIRDHDQYGQAFDQYQAIKAVQEREQRRMELEEARQRAETARQERMERLREARARRAAERGEQVAAERYRRAGFEPIGLDIYVGRMAYAYAVKDVKDVDITYDPWFGFYRRDDVRNEIDYTQMTISGSVVNGGDETRNIGIAVTFFDRAGNQVAHETVQINNARPDVPYPFTSRVSVALNDRAFSSSTAYVLYADPVDFSQPGE